MMARFENLTIITFRINKIYISYFMILTVFVLESEVTFTK